MIFSLMPGIFTNRAVWLLAKSLINAGSEDAGRPSGKAAAAILLRRRLEILELKILPSNMAINMAINMSHHCLTDLTNMY